MLSARLPQLGQAHSRARPHLRPLDLAAPPTLSHKSSSVSLTHPAHSIFANTNTSSPRRTGSLLTPPLTPSSSFASSATSATTSERDNIVPSTPPEGGSPLRWGALKQAALAKSRRVGSGYFTPPSAKDEREREIDIAASGVGGPTLAELSARFGKIELDDTTPRLEKTQTLSLDRSQIDGETALEKEKELEDILGPDDGEPTRFLLVCHIPPTTPIEKLRDAFGTRDIKGIHVRFQATHGAVFLAYFDVRTATRSRRALHGATIAELCSLPGTDRLADERTPLSVRGVSTPSLQKLIGQSPLVVEMDASFVVSVENRIVTPGDMQQLLTSFGELMSFNVVGNQGAAQVCMDSPIYAPCDR